MNLIFNNKNMPSGYIRQINIGDKFNNWIIIKEEERTQSRRFLCKNSITSKEKSIRLCHLISGASKGIDRSTIKKHGLSKTRQWRIWMGIKARCNNPKEQNYQYYGGKGIRICERWKKFENFWEDMKEGYDDTMTIERMNNDSDYCKDNCKWIPKSDQKYNKSSNCIIEYNDVSKPLIVWAEEYNINSKTLWARYYKYGFRGEKLFSKINYSNGVKNKTVKKPSQNF